MIVEKQCGHFWIECFMFHFAICRFRLFDAYHDVSCTLFIATDHISATFLLSTWFYSLSCFFHVLPMDIAKGVCTKQCSGAADPKSHWNSNDESRCAQDLPPLPKPLQEGLWFFVSSYEEVPTLLWILAKKRKPKIFLFAGSPCSVHDVWLFDFRTFFKTNYFAWSLVFVENWPSVSQAIPWGHRICQPPDRTCCRRSWNVIGFVKRWVDGCWWVDWFLGW